MSSALYHHSLCPKGWPVVKERVLLLFPTSLDDGELPTQWSNAKIIPLKKPNKADYTVAKAWRPISLLSTRYMLLTES
jgi:hypothetical protein